VARLAGAIRVAVISERLLRQGIPATTIDSLVETPAVLHIERFVTRDRGVRADAKLVLAAFVAFFLYISIVMYGQSMLSGVIEEKLSRVAEVVISSVRPETLLAGKVLGVSGVGLTQQLIWITIPTAIVAWREHTGVAPAAGTGGSITLAAIQAARALPTGWVALVVLFFLLGFIFFGSLYAAVGATVSTESDARQASQPVMLLLVTTAIFIQPVMTDPSGRLSRIMSLVPFSAPILMPLRIAISDVPATEVAASIVILAITCVGAVWIAARIYRTGLLMYGKRPTLRELLRWARG